MAEGSTSVSRETQDVLASYSRMLLRWNSTHNLIAKSSEQELWNRHIVDSTQLYKLVPPRPETWIDLGSGAGLPGVVLAILSKGKGEKTAFTLVESNHKKASFLKAVARDFELKINVENARIEDIDSSPYDVISARALAPLTQLLRYAEKFAGARTVCLFPKGKTAEDELTEARKHWNIKATRAPSQTSSSSVIFRIEEFHDVR